MRRKDEMLIGEWAVLALLCERPAHGYAIATAMAPDGEIGQIWSLGQPLTYRTLKVLRQLELVEVAAVKPGNQAPQRTEYKATTKAKRMVARWLQTPEPHVRDLRSALLLKLHMLQRRGRSPLRLLTAQRDLLAAQAEALANGDGESRQPDALIREWRRAMTNASLAFVEEAIERESATAHTV